MPRPRTRPNNPFIERMLSKYGCADLMELSKATKIPYGTLRFYADIQPGTEHQTYTALLRDSAALGLTADEFMRALLGTNAEERVAG
jgi:hypothetical protein